uniref:Late embryogenesis abundant protein LEA-2 subgroup domain-containing protein n=1 Tax=Ananas comosus var. bracteatus TaxID=296719 RepID=A0A6V7NFS2_ANACO|nr:unnamed protein product [Ananas comosus var. bracteatus]
MTESGGDTKPFRSAGSPAPAAAAPASSPPPPNPGKPRPGKRGRRCRCCLLCVAVGVAALGVLALVLALTLFRVRDPVTEIVSTRVSGIAPRVSLPAASIQLNVTLDLLVRVYNPNRAAFAHGVGRSALSYRGAAVGDAAVEPGRIPSHGTGLVRLTLTVEADRFAAQLGNLLGDVLAGQIPLDSETVIPGRVTILGFIKRHAVARSECHVDVGIPDLAVRSQNCTNKTQL